MNGPYDPHHNEPIAHAAGWSISNKGKTRERRCTLLASSWWVVIQCAWCESAQRVTWAYYITTTQGDIIYQSRDPYFTHDEATTSALAHASNIAKDIIEDAQGVRP